jgi:hypothetical protein
MITQSLALAAEAFCAELGLTGFGECGPGYRLWDRK